MQIKHEAIAISISVPRQFPSRARIVAICERHFRHPPTCTREGTEREKTERRAVAGSSSAAKESGGVAYRRAIPAPEKGAAALFRRLSQVADIIYRRGDKKRDV